MIKTLQNRIRNTSLRTQLSFMMIALSLITVVVVAGALSSNFYRSIERSAISDYSKMTSQITANINESIHTVDQYYYFLISNRQVFKAIQDEQFGKTSDSYENVLYLKGLLYSLITITDGLQSALFVSTNGTIVSSLSGFSYPEFLTEEYFFKNEIVQDLMNNPTKTVWYSDDISNSGYLYYMKGIRDPGDGHVLGIITFIIHTDLFENQISSLTGNKYNIYICDGDGVPFISSTSEASFDASLFDTLVANTSQTVIEQDDRFYIGLKTNNSWMVVTEVQKSDLINSRGIFFYGIVTALISMIIGVGLSMLSVRKFTTDLRSIVEVMKSTENGKLHEIKVDASNFESRALVKSYNEMIHNIETLNETLLSEMEEKILAEQKSVYLQSLWDNMFENSVEGIVVTDAEGLVERTNKRFSAITGYGPEEIMGNSTSLLKSGRHSQDFYDEMWQSLISNGKWAGEIWNRRKSGEAYPEWLGITSYIEQGSGRLMYFAVFHDISDIKQQEEQLQWMTNYDALTGLPKRHIFVDKMHSEIRAAERNSEICACMVMNIDGLQSINNKYGAQAGDSVLQEIGRRLKLTMRDEDFVSRFGGDEFAIFTPRLKEREIVLPILKRIQQSIMEPIKTDILTVEITASFGISLFPLDAENSQDLITKASLALSRTKQNRKGTYSLFDSELDNKILANSEIEMNLRKALTLGEFEVYYQPKVDASIGKVIGFEALIRWFRGGDIFKTPDKFIPVAEDTGMIVEIGYFVIREACDFMNKLRENGHADIIVGVNISARQFSEPDFIENLIAIVDSKNIPHSSIDLEITESITASDVYNAIESLSRLSKSGFSISIDDFGTGYSSLKYLISLPFDTIKIDKSFVDAILENDGSDTILNTVISLAQSLGKKLVAEGVEMQEQRDYLVERNCPVIQGYLFSKPMSIEDALRFPDT